jgi:hypothetical protein
MRVRASTRTPRKLAGEVNVRSTADQTREGHLRSKVDHTRASIPEKKRWGNLGKGHVRPMAEHLGIWTPEIRTGEQYATYR